MYIYSSTTLSIKIKITVGNCLKYLKSDFSWSKVKPSKLKQVCSRYFDIMKILTLDRLISGIPSSWAHLFQSLSNIADFLNNVHLDITLKIHKDFDT